MKILKTINDIKLNILKDISENKTKKLKLKAELKKQEIVNFEIENKHYINNTRLKFMKSSKNTKLLTLYLFFMIIGSTLMTCAGLKTFAMLASNDKLIRNMGIVLILILIKIQFLTFYGSAIYSYVYNNFNIHSKKLKFIPMILLPVSILGNFNFLKIFIVAFGNKYIDYSITMLICIVYDLSIITFMGYRYDKKHLIYSHFDGENLQEDVSIISMIMFIITNWFRQKIKPKYINSLKKYKDGLKNNSDGLNKSLDQNGNGLTVLDQNKKSLDSLNETLDQDKNGLNLNKNNSDGLKETINILKPNKTKNNEKQVIPIVLKNILDQDKTTKDSPKIDLDQNKNGLNFNKNNSDGLKNCSDSSKKSSDQNGNGLTVLDGSKKIVDQEKNKREIEESEKLSYSELLNAIKSLIYAYEENDEIKALTFKNLFSIDTQTWRKIRKQLQKENLIYTKEGTKRSYKSKNIRSEILAK